MTLPAPSDDQVARLAQAIIAKATRFLVQAGAPLGTFGELTDMGVATVRPDYQIRELLFGLHQPEWATDMGTLVAPTDVIRAGLMVDPATFPTDRIPDVQRAIDAAVSWITDEIYGAFGVA